MTVETGDVLLLALEDTRRRLQSRLETMLGENIAPDRLHIATQWPRADEGGLTELENWISSHPDTRLIVIDTWPRFRPRRTKSKDAFQDDYQDASQLKELSDRHPGL